MSYNVNIPQPTDSILQSASQIRANFQAINEAFADNHVGLTQDPEFSGMHNVLTLRPQTVDPATSATQIALYQKLVSTIPEIFFAPSSSQTPIQLTYPSIKSDLSDTQYTFIAGPFIIYAGKVSNPTIGQTVTLSPGTTLLYVDLTMANTNILNTSTTLAPTNILGTSFDISYQAVSFPIQFDAYYFAIGV